MSGTPNHNPFTGNGVDRRQVAIRFFPDTANDPSTIYDPHDDISSITHNATGEFIVTFKYPVFRIIGAGAVLQMATPGQEKARLGTTTENSGSDLTAVVWIVNSAGTAVDIAANANNSILLDFAFELSQAGNG